MNTENNKKIAEFMGLTIITDNISYFDTAYNPLKKYHSSWDWLMEVVEKIRELGFYYQIHPNRCFFTQESQEIAFGEDEGVKNNVYNAVIAFIDWYNENGAKEN